MNSIISPYNSPFRTDFGDYHLMNEKDEEEIKIVDFLEESEGDKFVISLYSVLFAVSQLKISIRSSQIILLISEQVDAKRSCSMFVSDWQSYNSQSYIKMRTVSLLLPGDNFFLLRHILIPESHLLKIFLGRLADN